MRLNKSSNKIIENMASLDGGGLYGTKMLLTLPDKHNAACYCTLIGCRIWHCGCVFISVSLGVGDYHYDTETEPETGFKPFDSVGSGYSLDLKGLEEANFAVTNECGQHERVDILLLEWD